ncbi:MAG: STAS domain-containing protein [Planctomycetota bacterium]
MDVTASSDGRGRYIVSCPEKMEWDARVDLVKAVDDAVDDAGATIILDLANVTYANSAGLGAIFALRKHLVSSGGTLVLARPTPPIRRLLETTNVPALIPVSRSLDEARAVVEQAARPGEDEA